MLSIRSRIAGAQRLRSLFLALLCVLTATAASAHRIQNARTAKMLSFIQEVKAADDNRTREEKAVALAFYLKKTVQSGHVSAVTDDVLQGLGDLLDKRDIWLDVTLAIGQIGPRAIVLAPKLNRIIEEVRREEKGSIVAQPIDAIDGSCVALRAMKATMPEICAERLAGSPPP